jgi:hypothetical protein
MNAIFFAIIAKDLGNGFVKTEITGPILCYATRKNRDRKKVAYKQSQNQVNLLSTLSKLLIY